MDHRATYSPEDNKLRLYPACRLDADELQRVKSHGFKWAPKQELFVAPKWTPEREDLLLELCGDIGDEDYSALERAADRAERFGNYRDKRAAEALGHADRYESGPAAFGHQNRQRAERQAAMADRVRVRGVSQWSKAEYWNERTAAVISHALYKADPKVRRGRILKIEADLRGRQKSLDESRERWRLWQKVAELQGADDTVTMDGWTIDRAANSPAVMLAYGLANSASCWLKFAHPVTGRELDLQSLLADSESPITARQAAELYLSRVADPFREGSRSMRWLKHYELRLEYERAMLANEGGTAAEVEIIPGGWFGRHQVLKVNKSPATGKVVSVGVWGPHPWRTNPDGSPQMGVQTLNIQRMAEDAYRPPTPDELREFQAAEKVRKATKKATTPKAPSLINPTEEDAIRLQGLWNAEAAERYARYLGDKPYATDRELAPTNITRMTQKQYSAMSKGTYARYESVEVCDNGLRQRGRWDGEPLPVVCKVRKGPMPNEGGFSHRAYSVVLITDKPQKPLPLDWEALEVAAEQEAATC